MRFCRWTVLFLTGILFCACSTIHQGAMRGDIDAIKGALDRGAEIDDRYAGECHITQMTPLMVAAYYGQTNAVKYLLKAGADPKATCTNQCDVRFAYGVNALILGAICRGEKGCGQIVRLLIDKEETLSPSNNINVLRAYYWAVTDLKTESLKALFEKGVDVNFRFKNGDTPLLMAIDNLGQRRGEIEFIDFLIKSGADIKVRNQAGEDARQLVFKKEKEFKDKWKAECERCEKILQVLNDARWRQ